MTGNEPMKNFDEWLPKEKEVVVGETKLIVKELTIAKRDAVLKLIS